MSLRKIIHIDMDAFYASVEQRDYPEYRGKPLVVGGGSERGVVAAASYEARKFGVRSAMSGIKARNLCPQLVFMKPRFEHYKAISEQIRNIFLEYTSLVEPLSLDEAFLDVTHPLKGKNSATLIANEIRCRIKQETGLTASAGISYNKFLAKMASDMNKPNGYYLIRPEDAIAYIDTLPIQKFYGVGKVGAKRFVHLGIHTGADLRKASLELLVKNFGKSGWFFYNIARGSDHRAVEPGRERKSVGAENTFHNDLVQEQELNQALQDLTQVLEERLKRVKMFGKTLTLKVKYNDFSLMSRSKSFAVVVKDSTFILNTVCKLLHEHRESEKPIRLLGITFSQLEYAFNTPGKQLELDFFEKHDL